MTGGLRIRKPLRERLTPRQRDRRDQRLWRRASTRRPQPVPMFRLKDFYDSLLPNWRFLFDRDIRLQKERKRRSRTRRGLR